MKIIWSPRPGSLLYEAEIQLGISISGKESGEGGDERTKREMRTMVVTTGMNLTSVLRIIGQ